MPANNPEKLDVQALLQKSPADLPNFINPNQDSEDSGGQAHSTSLSLTKGIAALREAQGLSSSYAPAGAAKEVAQMAASAQYNLGIESAQGLAPNMGPAGSQSDSED
jgi:hypothetical protein